MNKKSYIYKTNYNKKKISIKIFSKIKIIKIINSKKNKS